MTSSIASVARSAEELLHELQVHQIELEMQNEELRRAHIALEEISDRYRDLYDFAPVGYLLINRNSLISEINLTACGQLGVERSKLLNRRFAAFVTAEDSDRWHLFFSSAMKGNKRQNTELMLKYFNGTAFPAQLDCIHVSSNVDEPMLRITLTDITDSRRAEAAFQQIKADKLTQQLLEENEIYQSNIFDSTPDAMLITDQQDRVVRVNRQAEILLGYSAMDLVGLSIETLLPDRFRKCRMSLSAQFSATGAASSMTLGAELKALCKGGGAIDVDANLSSIKTSQGLVYACTLRDITEQKRMLEAIISSEKEFRWLAETMPQIVWVTRADGWNIYFNQQWMDYTGLTLEESYGHGWNKPFHPDDQQRAWDAWQSAVNNNSTYSLECRLRRADGLYRWWLVGGKPILDQLGKIYKWFGTCTDIHEIKEAEHRLRDKELLLAESQAIAHIGSWSIDLVTGSIIWSDEMYRICGINKETFKPSTKTLLELIHPDDRYMMENMLIDAFAKIEPVDMNFRILRSDGTVRVICSNGGLQYDKNNNPVRMMGTVHDITDRRHLEQQDRQHLLELAHVTRLGLMGEMASGIAHEVNQPLTAIATYTQVSINLIKTEHPDLAKLAEIAVKTQQQAIRAGKIIHRMKEFGRSHVQQRASTDLNNLIYNAADFFVTELKNHNVTLDFKLTKNLPHVFVDHIQIEQVVINLIRNSVDALQDLPPNIQRLIIIRSFLISNNAIQVSITDNGLGINDDEKQKILTPFHTTKINGTGMGLSISRSLIELYEGSLYFNSEPGKGSTFYFTLPIETAGKEGKSLGKSQKIIQY